MIRPRWVCAALALLLVAPACSDDGEPDATPTTTSVVDETPTVSSDPCDDVTLEEIEVGVTDDEIVVEVVADTSGPGVSDRARAAVEAVKAWADEVNDRGGLACRDVKVREWDSRLAPDDTAKGTLDACENAVAMIGTSALLLIDSHTLANCPDDGRAALGVPDLPERAVEVPHQCNATTFTVVASPGSCPYTGGPRQFVELVGPFGYFANLVPGTTATIIAAGETPSTKAASLNRAIAAQTSGLLTIDGDIEATEHDRSEATARALDLIASAGSQAVYSDAHPAVLAELRKQSAEAATTPVNLWACSSACYVPSFAESDEVAGTYVWLPHLPFEEADSVPALRAYIDAIDDRGKARTAGLAAWTAATTFELVVERIVERDGYNAITRAAILDELTALRTSAVATDATAVYGPQHAFGGPASCFVVMRVRDGEFRRIHPALPGTLDCEPGNVATVERDPATPAA